VSPTVYTSRSSSNMSIMKSALANGSRLVRQRCCAAASSRSPSLQAGPREQVLHQSSAPPPLVSYERRSSSTSPSIITTRQQLQQQRRASLSTATTTSTTATRGRGTRNNNKTRLSKLLTREMLKTKREWIPLDDDFRDIKLSIESDWTVSYSNNNNDKNQNSITLRCPLVQEDSDNDATNSAAAYIEIVCQADDLVREEQHEQKDDTNSSNNSEDAPPKHKVNVDSSGADDGLWKAEFFLNADDDSNNTNNANVPRVMGVLFQLKLVQPGGDNNQQPQASPPGTILLDCGMDAGESNVHIFHMHCEYNNSDNSDNKNNKLELSPKFRHPNAVYAALQTFLARDCGIDEMVGMFLINYHVFRMQKEKLQFLQGVKTFLE